MSRYGVWVGCCVIAAAVLSLGAVASGGGQGSPLRVGFVFQSASVGRTSDPVEYGAYVGLRKAVEELGVVGKGVAPSPSETFLPAISYLARKHFDLIIALGFLEARDLAVAARRFPDRKFAILDVRWQALEGKPTNVEGTWFKTEQAGYLAGYLAALMEKRRPGRHVISSVGGYSVPQVNAYIAGYQAGAKRADPHVVTLNGYSNDSSIRVSVSGLR